MHSFPVEFVNKDVDADKLVIYFNWFYLHNCNIIIIIL